MTVQRKWREWLTNNLIDYWVDNDRYANPVLVKETWRRLSWQLVHTTLVSKENTSLAPIVGLVLFSPEIFGGNAFSSSARSRNLVGRCSEDGTSPSSPSRRFEDDLLRKALDVVGQAKARTQVQ
jgi:hypothetical protein